MSSIISKCQDFNNQNTDLEVLCAKITTDLPFEVSILSTPKFYCKLAGEGIEYTWGASKRMYRRQSIQMKRSVADFEMLVPKSLNYISIGMVRRFSGKARSCMLAYSHKLFEEEDEGSNSLVTSEWNFDRNDKIQKIYRSHRDVSTTGGKCIEQVLKEASCIKVEKLQNLNMNVNTN